VFFSSRSASGRYGHRRPFRHRHWHLHCYWWICPRLLSQGAAHYGVHRLDRREDWLSEPHVGEAIFRDMLRDSGLKVYYHTRLREPRGVTLENRTMSPSRPRMQQCGKDFADCTYEGDLMAQSNVSYTWGRESSEEYGEDLAGVRSHTPNTSSPGRWPPTMNITNYSLRSSWVRWRPQVRRQKSAGLQLPLDPH